MTSNWIRVSKRQICPICGKPDWCGISKDGTTVHCMRYESNRPTRAGGWIHKLNEPLQAKPAYRVKPRKPSTVNFATMAKFCTEKLDVKELDDFAKHLGVSMASLIKLHVGRNAQGFTFPMFSATSEIIGMRVRSERGKWAVTGSRNGIFWPMDVDRDDTQLLICEGPTDCAALIDMSYKVIGRPSCNSGVDIIKDFLRFSRRDVVIMSDKDEPKKRPDGTEYRPGQEGSHNLAKAIHNRCKSVKIVKPPHHKDIRQWYNRLQQRGYDTATIRLTVDTVIDNTKEWSYE